MKKQYMAAKQTYAFRLLFLYSRKNNKPHSVATRGFAWTRSEAAYLHHSHAHGLSAKLTGPAWHPEHPDMLPDQEQDRAALKPSCHSCYRQGTAGRSACRQRLLLECWFFWVLGFYPAACPPRNCNTLAALTTTPARNPQNDSHVRSCRTMPGQLLGGSHSHWLVKVGLDASSQAYRAAS